MRVEILVRPHASKAGVGGTHDGALVIHVTEPPAGGRATRAALLALADALGVRPRAVTLVRGPTTRRKVVEIEATAAQRARLQDRLLKLSRNGD